MINSLSSWSIHATKNRDAYLCYGMVFRIFRFQRPTHPTAERGTNDVCGIAKKKRCAERTRERRREKTGGTVWSVSSSRYGEGVMGQPGRTAAQPHFLCLPPLLVSVILTGLLATSFFFLKSYGGWGNASQRWPVAKNDYLRVICAKASCRLAFQRGVGYTRRKVIHHY